MPVRTRLSRLGAVFAALAFCLLPGPGQIFAYEDTLTTEAIQGTLEGTRLNEIFEQYLATVQIFDPERATRLGIHSADPYLTMRTPERVAKHLAAIKALRAKLQQINKAAMSPALKVDMETFDRIMEVDAYELEKLQIISKRPQYYLEPLLLIYQMLQKDYTDYNTRAGSALARLRLLPSLLEQAERNLTRPPEAWTRHAIRQCSDFLQNVSDMVAAFRNYTRFDPVQKGQVDDALDKAKVAIARYQAFLEKDILPVSDGEMRLGGADYGFYLERQHSVDMTPGAAYGLAKSAFKDARRELEREALTIDALLAKEKGWKGVLDKLPKDHPPASEVLKVFQDEMDRAYQHFDENKVVGFPKQRLLIKQMPNFIGSVLPYVHYSPGFPLDDTRVSELFVLLPPDTASDAAREKTLSTAFNFAQIELLAAFSIMPGIHLRNYEASLNNSRIRRISRQPAVANGWACYSEQLAEEMGFYSSYWSRFLRIYVKLLRAARAYADAGLHTKRLTPAEASEFFQESLFMSKAQADSEVLKVSVAPTEAFSYVYGLQRILYMRRYYERTEAKLFDLRKFHTLFLKQGDISMARIEEEVRRQKADEKRIIR